LLRLFEYGLATWRLSRMAVHEDGPAGVFAALRERTGIEYDGAGNAISWPPANPLHCMFCTSVWAAFALLAMPVWVRRVLAGSAVAVLIESCTRVPESVVVQPMEMTPGLDHYGDDPIVWTN